MTTIKRSRKRIASQKKDQQPKERKRSFLRRIILKIKITIRFFTQEMWRISDDEVTGIRRVWITIAKPIYLSIRAFIKDRLSNKASALTYSTILSIVPMLAVLTGVAKGFGLQSVLRNSLEAYLPSHQYELEQAFEFVENYLSRVQGGLFIGIGLALLIYTVVNLLVQIENAFNSVWQCTRQRPWSRRILDYLAMFILLPIIMVLQSGITLAMTTVTAPFLSEYIIVAPIISLLLRAIPFFIIIFVFTGIYIAFPYTKVRFTPAFIAGILAGVGFQVLQALYMSGMLWITKYNAIYGSYAAIPLLLLFIQVSWIICLFGAQLSFSIQNVRLFSFEQDVSKISRRYLDFLTLLVAERIVKRFTSGKEPPYTSEELSSECHIPIRLTNKIIKRLLALGVVIEVNYKGDLASECFQPAIDPDKLSVAYLIDRLDSSGSELFKVDNLGKYLPIWQAMLESRSGLESIETETLLKDL